jgi:hypothetical protein
MSFWKRVTAPFNNVVSTIKDNVNTLTSPQVWAESLDVARAVTPAAAPTPLTCPVCGRNGKKNFKFSSNTHYHCSGCQAWWRKDGRPLDGHVVTPKPAPNEIERLFGPEYLQPAAKSSLHTERGPAAFERAKMRLIPPGK